MLLMVVRCLRATRDKTRVLVVWILSSSLVTASLLVPLEVRLEALLEFSSLLGARRLELWRCSRPRRCTGSVCTKVYVFVQSDTSFVNPVCMLIPIFADRQPMAVSRIPSSSDGARNCATRQRRKKRDDRRVKTRVKIKSSHSRGDCEKNRRGFRAKEEMEADQGRPDLGERAGDVGRKLTPASTLRRVSESTLPTSISRFYVDYLSCWSLLPSELTHRPTRRIKSTSAQELS
jgi:hypothetical protein